MKLNLKDQSSAHEMQRSTIKSKYAISAKAVIYFTAFPCCFWRKYFCVFISFFFELSNLLYEQI